MTQALSTSCSISSDIYRIQRTGGAFSRCYIYIHHIFKHK